LNQEFNSSKLGIKNKINIDMKYTIIEDCSPFYIRFTYDNIDAILQKSTELIRGIKFEKSFTHYKYPDEHSRQILDMVPLINDVELNPYRISMFVTQPGGYYRAHKDGLNIKFGINYTVKILDDKCITNWYSDEDLKNYEIDNLPRKISRECVNFDKTNHTPIKSMTAIQGECILFNTDIFHDVDNRASTNERMMLTFRPFKPENICFDDVKKIIFNKIKL